SCSSRSARADSSRPRGGRPMREDLNALARPAPLLSRRGWAAFLALGFVLIVLVPLLNLLPGSGSAAHLPDYLVPLLGKYACYAILALSLDLVWGYAGILSLGHG